MLLYSFLGKHSLYFSFDTLENLVLMEGTEQGNFDPQGEGQVQFILSLDRWVQITFY